MPNIINNNSKKYSCFFHIFIANCKEILPTLRKSYTFFPKTAKDEKKGTVARPLFTVYSSLHRRFRSTARCQPRRSPSLSVASICGKKTRSTFHSLRNSSRSAKTPTARPARVAAPHAVVSTQAGRIREIPRISAWNCNKKLFADAPPSTRKEVSGRVASLCIAVSTSPV